MEDNVKSFLEKIQDIKTQKTKVWVSSEKKEVNCERLTFKQQKDLISTIGDGTVGALKMQKILNDIIVSNTDNQDLLVTDRLGIVLQIRCDSISNFIKDGEAEIPLDSFIEKSKKVEYVTSKTIKGAITVDLQVPTLLSENKVIQATIDSVKKESDDDLGKSIGNIYTYEIVKFIKFVEFGDSVLQFSDLPVKDRYKIVENLPLSINKEIITFIQDIKNKENEVLKYEVDGVTKNITIDVSFFDS